MIGHYLLSLTPEAERDVLTHKMAPGSYAGSLSGARCLVGVCADFLAYLTPDSPRPSYWPQRKRHVPKGRSSIEHQYDGLCLRFGSDRINAAIRARVLTNMARRTLSRQYEYATVRP